MRTLNAEDYIKKISKVESMLGEIKRGLTLFDSKFQKSIKKGEQDIPSRPPSMSYQGVVQTRPENFPVAPFHQFALNMISSRCIPHDTCI